MQIILSVLVLILAEIDLRQAQKVKDLEERTIEALELFVAGSRRKNNCT